MVDVREAGATADIEAREIFILFSSFFFEIVNNKKNFFRIVLRFPALLSCRCGMMLTNDQLPILRV